MRMWRALCALAGLVLVVYAFWVQSYARFGVGNVLCLLLGLPLLFVALLWGPLHAGKLGRALLVVMRVGYAACAVCLAVCLSLMVSANRQTPKAGADVVIVLGAGLRGEQLSLTLRRRLDAALPYLKANPQAFCVVSGGQGPDEVIPESTAMARYLADNGIDPARIGEEAASRNTAENLALSRAHLEERGAPTTRVVVVTSDFHLYRGMALARGQGFPVVEGIGSPSVTPLLPQYVLRETVSLCKDGLFGRYGQGE